MERAEGGHGIVEYGLILAGSVLVMYVTLVFLGPVLADILGWIGDVIDAATGGS